MNKTDIINSTSNIFINHLTTPESYHRKLTSIYLHFVIYIYNLFFVYIFYFSQSSFQETIFVSRLIDSSI